jgi:hypothetical protein
LVVVAALKLHLGQLLHSPVGAVVLVDLMVLGTTGLVGTPKLEQTVDQVGQVSAVLLGLAEHLLLVAQTAVTAATF